MNVLVVGAWSASFLFSLDTAFGYNSKDRPLRKRLEIWCHNGHTREGQFGIVDAGKDMVIPHCDNIF